MQKLEIRQLKENIINLVKNAQLIPSEGAGHSMTNNYMSVQ